MSTDLVVIARNAPEMAVAQQGLVKWSDEKVAEAASDLADLEANLDLAKKAGWRTEGPRRAVMLAKKQIQFYGKIGDALRAGYVIVPNFPIDVFAIRTTRKEPTGREENYQGARHLQHSNAPPAGEGVYRSPDPVIGSATHTVEKDGKQIQKVSTWAEEFKDVLFPITAVKAQIIEDTAAAMQKAVFDEIGIAPPGRQKDPMIIGRIFFKNGATWYRREVSFLISWWLTNRDLELRRLV